MKHKASGILVDATYAGRLADAVRRLAADPGLRERLGRAGQQKVRQEFDVRRNAASGLDALRPLRGTERRQARRRGPRPRPELVAPQHLRPRRPRIHERHDAFVAEVTITDGITKRDVIVRQPRAEEGQPPPQIRARAEFEALSRCASR